MKMNGSGDPSKQVEGLALGAVTDGLSRRYTGIETGR